MRGPARTRRWRSAIALMAAYALALQAFLAVSIATEAAAQGNFSALLTLCTAGHDDPAAQGDAGAPVKHAVHCPICTLAAAAGAMAPPSIVPLLPPAGAAQKLAFVSADACLGFHQSRAGLSRAPPGDA